MKYRSGIAKPGVMALGPVGKATTARYAADYVHGPSNPVLWCSRQRISGKDLPRRVRCLVKTLSSATGCNFSRRLDQFWVTGVRRPLSQDNAIDQSSSHRGRNGRVSHP